MWGRSFGAICLWSAGCVLDATGGLDASRGGSGSVSASSTAESASSTATSASSGIDLACGDGMMGPFEPCDDGGRVSGDGCSDGCLVEPGYICRGVPSVCTVCGDSLVLEGETCEDGNLRTDDGCNGCNAIHDCGNGAVEPTEACDQSGAESPCTNTCTFAPNSECTAAVDLAAITEPTLLRGLYEGNTLGATDTLFPEHLMMAPNNQGLGNCVNAGKPRNVPIVKHRYTTGPYPSIFEARITVPAVADANVNPVAWAYRGCDVSTLDVVCNDNGIDFGPSLRTPLLPPLSTVVVAVSGYVTTDVGRYTLHYREVEVPWQEDLTALPVAGDLVSSGIAQICHDNCGTLDVCDAPGCPDGHFLKIEDPAGASPAAYLTSRPIAWRGQQHVDLELRHESNAPADATLTILVSTDQVVYTPVKTINPPFKKREIVELFPQPTAPSQTFYVRITFQGSPGAGVGDYRLGLARVRLFSDQL